MRRSIFLTLIITLLLSFGIAFLLNDTALIKRQKVETEEVCVGLALGICGPTSVLSTKKAYLGFPLVHTTYSGYNGDLSTDPSNNPGNIINSSLEKKYQNYALIIGVSMSLAALFIILKKNYANHRD